MDFYSMEKFEIVADYMEEVAEWLAYEADMMADPFGDANWADRQELG